MVIYDTSQSPPRLRKVLLLLLPLFAIQIALYYRSFGVKPASDDFPVVNEILRGNEYGPGIFFTHAMGAEHHRPFKSLGEWAFGNISHEHRVFWIRVLHFCGMVLFLFVLALWIAKLRLSTIGVIVAACAMLFHPVLPQALSSIDGVDSIASSALVWLAAWFVMVYAERLAISLPAMVICFILAAGWKEYAFAVVPLCTWTALCFTKAPHRWRNTILVFVTSVIVFGLIILYRQKVMPGGYGLVKGSDYASPSPVQWAINAVWFTIGLLFFGNTIWVFVHQGIFAAAVVGLSVLIAAAVILAGLRRWKLRGGQSASPWPKLSPSGLWLVFLFVSFAAASFPANIMFHVSEMYVPPLIFPLALLCGMAADGLRSASRGVRAFAIAAAVIALISSMFTIVVKIEGLRDVGERAEMQIRDVLSQIPPDAHDVKVAVLFDPTRLPNRRTYAVYRMGDDSLVVQEQAFNWLVPERHLTWESFYNDAPDFHPEEYAYIFQWDPEAKKFRPWSESILPAHL
jgi:hypothetical protein